MNLHAWFAFWRAHPSAPETKRLALLRRQFTISTLVVALLGLRTTGDWPRHGWEALAVPPLLVFSLIAGARYFRLKDTADKDHVDSLIRQASEQQP